MPRESVPFRLVTADGETIDLSYSSLRPAAEHDEQALLAETPWFEPGKPLRNDFLHETDFYDEVDRRASLRHARAGSRSALTRLGRTRPNGGVRHRICQAKCVTKV